MTIPQIRFQRHFRRACLVMLLLLVPSSLWAVDMEELSGRVATSLTQIANRKYGTVAFSRITGPLDQNSVNDLIDYTNVSLVKSRAFRVIDRSKLNLILSEQKFNLSGMVSQDTYKELGKLLGVDLFVYGRFYRDVLVMKAIDVESSAIVWADIFQMGQLSGPTLAASNLAEQVALSLRKDLSRLQQNKIRQISFWNINSTLDGQLLTDFLSTAITKDGNFQVVDRENLALILEEQKLSMTDFIDESKAKRMGELYGVDAFIYGKITPKESGYMASLKLLNIYNGVIEWADLIRFGGAETPASSTPTAKGEADMVLIPKGSFKMGSNQGSLLNQPEFSVDLKEFYLDKQEVANKDYAEYLKKYNKRQPPHWQGSFPPGEEEYPVVNVTWDEANHYCQTQGKRLPKEVEWEKAARGTEGLEYPWGNQFVSGAAQTVEAGQMGPHPVNDPARDVSVYGVYHLAGNVREWVESYVQPYPGSSFFGPEVGVDKIIRGGSWAQNQESSRLWVRTPSKKTFAWKDVGFRCARF